MIQIPNSAKADETVRSSQKSVAFELLLRSTTTKYIAGTPARQLPPPQLLLDDIIRLNKELKEKT